MRRFYAPLRCFQGQIVLKPTHRFSQCLTLSSASSTEPIGGEKEQVSIKWLRKDGSIKPTLCDVGKTLLQVAHQYDIELEGACEGVCACSTCHVILEDGIFNKLPDPSEEEEDMLDQAFGLTPTSRLGCQVKVEKHHDGMLVKIPHATRNFYVDGHVPKPH